MSFLSVDELKTFKKITGGDSLYAEFKGQQAFEFIYNGLLWFCMNRLPKFGGYDGKWVYDRIMVVRCPNVISEDKQDKTLLDKSMRDGKRELEQSQARISKLDEIIQRLYEDNIEGKISDERFAKISANYESGQYTLENRIAELKSTMTEEKEAALNVDHFLALVRKYTDIKELTAETIRELVEKIYVYKAERIDGRRVQRIKIIYNCIGEFDSPVCTSTTEQEISA